MRVRGKISVPGFLAGGISAGIKHGKDMDLAMIVCQTQAVTAGVFTTNAVKAAHVLLDMERLKRGKCQAILINSGCANACTGKRGLEDARKVSRVAARCLGIPEKLVLVASTGLIGTPLPVEKISRGIKKLVPSLSPDGLSRAARSIMTTDTFPKVVLNKTRDFSIAGIAKGAGMIHPRMATMLCFILTDALIEWEVLKSALRRSVEGSFHRISVDGDMSTNDSVIIMSSGRQPLGKRGIGYFQDSLDEVTFRLSEMIVEDAEGATKKVEIIVKGAATLLDARRVAERIAVSPLVKTAIFGEDPNWGRIMAAIGSSGVQVSQDKIDIFYDKVQVVRHGKRYGGGCEARAKRVLKSDFPRIIVNLNTGKAQLRLLTCDLTEDYIKINAAYHT